MGPILAPWTLLSELIYLMVGTLSPFQEGKTFAGTEDAPHEQDIGRYNLK